MSIESISQKFVRHSDASDMMISLVEWEAVLSEVEALRAENAELKAERIEIKHAVMFSPSSANWSEELKRMLGSDARKGIDAIENSHRDSIPRIKAEAIREAFADPDHTVSKDEADDLGRVLLAICKEPLREARTAVDTLTPQVRTSLIRLYFRLLQRAEEERGQRH